MRGIIQISGADGNELQWPPVSFWRIKRWMRSTNRPTTMIYQAACPKYPHRELVRWKRFQKIRERVISLQFYKQKDSWITRECQGKCMELTVWRGRGCWETRPNLPSYKKVIFWEYCRIQLLTMTPTPMMEPPPKTQKELFQIINMFRALWMSWLVNFWKHIPKIERGRGCNKLEMRRVCLRRLRAKLLNLNNTFKNN